MRVWITVKTVREADGQREKLELVTAGDMERAAGGWTLAYQESESIGLVGVTTVLTVRPGCVTMERRGAVNTLMVMEKGKRTHCEYDTGFGALSMGIYTTGIEDGLGDGGGTVRFRYTLDINADMTSAHDVTILVRPAED